MKKHLRFIFLVSSIVLALSIGVVYAQSAGGYDLSWWSIDGGGDQVSAGGYVLASTAGQPDASTPLTAGGYSLTGGFWSGGAASTLHIYLPLQSK
ncbi:MAG: hypothetical protein GXP38_09735 [Chloroflexi bacterium]|nr:hypothetical protein [Chloroflexota bacterium]